MREKAWREFCERGPGWQQRAAPYQPVMIMPYFFAAVGVTGVVFFLATVFLAVVFFAVDFL
jgi:hypothetical protein